MNLSISKKKEVAEALHHALSLFNDEYETVINADLREQYKETIDEIEKAIKIIEKRL